MKTIYLLGYNAVQPVENQEAFWENMSPIITCFHIGMLLGLFDLEDGGDMFLRNESWLSGITKIGGCNNKWQ
jgi:hypothetical protein